jgi:iron complex outermembrane recepter protein
LGATYTYEKLTVNILEKIYGPSHEWEGDDGDNATNTLNWYKTTIGITPITNIDISYNLTKRLRVGVGANNAFNKLPGTYNPALMAAYDSPYGAANNDASSASPVPLFTPFGVDGGFYYGNLSYIF